MSENTIGVPDSDYKSIDYNGDVNTYDVWLTAGQSYDFDVYGAYNGDSDSISPGIFDPTLTVTGPDLTDPNDDAYNDDINYPIDFDSHIDFTAVSTGWYTLSVAGFGDETGSYTLSTNYDYSV
jgi:hypothetical protein